jgi:hypothetical protein
MKMRLHIMNSHSISLIAGLLLVTAQAPGQERKEWQDPKLTGLNNEAPHATMVICPYLYF